MNSYALVPVTCVAIYCFLLFSFIASKKDIMIKAYMYVLVAMILWTGGSFLMRINMFPSYEFWFNISILGLLSCVFTLFSFVIVYINKKYDYILSNPPIRVGKEKLYEIIMQAKNYLNNKGELWLVVRRDKGADSMVRDMKKNYSQVEIVERKKGFFIIKAER